MKLSLSVVQIQDYIKCVTLKNSRTDRLIILCLITKYDFSCYIVLGVKSLQWSKTPRWLPHTHASPNIESVCVSSGVSSGVPFPSHQWQTCCDCRILSSSSLWPPNNMSCLTAASPASTLISVLEKFLFLVLLSVVAMIHHNVPFISRLMYMHKCLCVALHWPFMVGCGGIWGWSMHAIFSFYSHMHF